MTEEGEEDVILTSNITDLIKALSETLNHLP